MIHNKAKEIKVKQKEREEISKLAKETEGMTEREVKKMKLKEQNKEYL